MRGAKHRRRRSTASLGTMVVMMLLVGVPLAAADPPNGRIVRETLTGTDVAAATSAACGARITYSYVYERMTRYLEEPYDASSPLQVIGKYRATITGPGGILINRENFRILVAADGTITYTGLPVRVMEANGRPIVQDVGFVTFDENFNVLVSHGPHPVGLGEFDHAVLCPYLV